MNGRGNDKYASSTDREGTFSIGELHSRIVRTSATKQATATDFLGRMAVRVSLIAFGCLLCISAFATSRVCGNLCDRDWMRTATVEDVRAAIKKTSVLTSERQNGSSALHFSALYNPNPEVTAFLIDAGLDIEATERAYGSTPLHLAAGGFGIFMKFHIMISLRRDVDGLESVPQVEFVRELETALIEKLGHIGNRPEVVRILLDRGAAINARDKHGATPLHRAAAGNPDAGVVAMLLAEGALVGARDRKDWAPMHRAAAFNSNPAVLDMLLQHGADIRINIGTDTTLLHMAAMNWNPEVIELVLPKGIDIDARDANMNTPMHVAAVGNMLPYVAELLFEHGAPLESLDGEGRTPLLSAIESGGTPFPAIALIELGANLDAIISDGKYPRNIDARILRASPRLRLKILLEKLWRDD